MANLRILGSLFSAVFFCTCCLHMSCAQDDILAAQCTETTSDLFAGAQILFFLMLGALSKELLFSDSPFASRLQQRAVGCEAS